MDMHPACLSPAGTWSWPWRNPWTAWHITSLWHSFVRCSSMHSQNPILVRSSHWRVRISSKAWHCRVRSPSLESYFYLLLWICLWVRHQLNGHWSPRFLSPCLCNWVSHLISHKRHIVLVIRSRTSSRRCCRTFRWSWFMPNDMLKTQESGHSSRWCYPIRWYSWYRGPYFCYCTGGSGYHLDFSPVMFIHNLDIILGC